MPEGFFYVSPEQLAAMQDKQHAVATAHYLNLHGFLESLNVDEIDMLEWMIERASHDSMFGHHIDGLLAGLKRYKHNICSCGENTHKVSDHDDPDFLAQLGKEEADSSHVTAHESQPEADALPDDIVANPKDDLDIYTEEDLTQTTPEVFAFKMQSGELGTLIAKTHRGEISIWSTKNAMEQYGLEFSSVPADAYTQRASEFKLRCRRCKFVYQTIEDRMLREPGIPGCDGCVQANKRGGIAPWDE